MTSISVTTFDEVEEKELTPVYIGFCGPAGSGKTTTARALVPPSAFSNFGEYPSTVWDHLWFAMPLYEMASFKTETLGENRKDRILYGLHDTVNAIMMKKIPYDDLVELVYDLYSMPCDNDGGTKPRTFLQQAGTMCRALNVNCFTDYIKYRVINTYRGLSLEYDRAEKDPPNYVAIISDVRQVNEAKMIKDQPRNLLIKFTARPGVLKQRLMDRDGVLLSDTQQNHESERGVNEIPDEWFDMILDASDMTVEEQAIAVQDFMKANL